MSLVDFSNVEKRFDGVYAVNGVTFSIDASSVIGLVGESGCGKSTIGKLALNLTDPSGGKVSFDGLDTQSFAGAALLSFRKRAQMVFQDPYASLNPRKTVFQTLSEGLVIHRLCTRKELKARVAHLLEKTGLDPRSMDLYPHEFSGGQRQRIAIARALSTEPSFIVADEPVSALDVSVQGQIIQLLLRLRAEMNLTFLFISHDFRVIEHVSDEVIVMYLGKIMERLPAKGIASIAQHPYTKSLLDAIPSVSFGTRKNRTILSGEPPDPRDPPKGCVFQARCPVVKDRCKTEPPMMKRLSDKHAVACHLV